MAWNATANSAFLHIAPGYGSGTGSSTVIFTIDGFNGTGSRTGTNQGGRQTVVVQHVQVTNGGQAVVAGEVTNRAGQNT